MAGPKRRKGADQSPAQQPTHTAVYPGMVTLPVFAPRMCLVAMLGGLLPSGQNLGDEVPAMVACATGTMKGREMARAHRAVR